MSDTCENCMYFKRDDNAPGMRCFRYPPAILIDHDVCFYYMRPMVDTPGFCGEFRVAEEVEADRTQLRLQIMYGTRKKTKEEDAAEMRSMILQSKRMLAEAGYVGEQQDGKTND